MAGFSSSCWALRSVSRRSTALSLPIAPGAFRTMSIRSVLLAVLLAAIAVVLVAPSADAQSAAGERWVLLASREVDLAKGTDSIDVSKARGRVKALRLEVDAAPIVLSRVQIIYNNGTQHSEDRRIDLKPGERTRPIDPRSEERFADRINLTFEPVAAARQRALVAVWGLQSAAGAVAVRSGPSVAPSALPTAASDITTATKTAARPPAPREPRPANGAGAPKSEPQVSAQPPDTGGTRGPVRPAAAASAASIPEFPWPPPKASGRLEIRRELLVTGAGTTPTLGQVTRRLQDALIAAGYGDQTFYRIKENGVALITRMERMLPDGRPDPDTTQRWRPPDERAPFSLTRFVSGLLFTQPGNYRVIVFTMSAEGLPPGRDTITGKQAGALVGAGHSTLPRWLAELPYTPEHSTFALIYEFAKDSPNAPAVFLDPSKLTALDHLQKSEIWSKLTGR